MKRVNLCCKTCGVDFSLYLAEGECEDYCPVHRKPKLSFAQIDAKVEGIIHLEGSSSGRATTKSNCRVVQNAVKEYLSRLEKLQNDIRKKYDLLLKPQPHSGVERELSEAYDEVWGKESKYKRFGELYYD